MSRSTVWLGIIAIGGLATYLAARFASPLAASLVSGLFLLGCASFTAVQARILEDFQKLAGSDDLTGLANRRKFRERLASANLSALILFDLDEFKAYNDEFGHVAGDCVLKELGSILPKKPVCYRVGGDEFAVVVDSSEIQVLHEVADSIRRTIIDHDWPNRSISASFGIAVVKGPVDPVALHCRADRALYAAKRQGGSRIVVDSG